MMMTRNNDVDGLGAANANPPTPQPASHDQTDAGGVLMVEHPNPTPDNPGEALWPGGTPPLMTHDITKQLANELKMWRLCKKLALKAGPPFLVNFFTKHANKHYHRWMQLHEFHTHIHHIPTTPPHHHTWLPSCIHHHDSPSEQPHPHTPRHAAP